MLKRTVRRDDEIKVDEINMLGATTTNGAMNGPDKVNCGRGEDTVTADPNDVLSNCENVTTNASP